MPQASTITAPRRRDAIARRTALLDAAALSFAEHGFDVPLQMVCERAGVGRATLYRNFADRTALAIALLERDLDRLEAHAARLADDPHGLDSLLATVLGMQILSAGLVFLLSSDPERNAELGARFSALLAPALDCARRAGTVRAELSMADLHLVTNMMLGAVQSLPYAKRRPMIPAILDLCRRAIAP